MLENVKTIIAGEGITILEDGDSITISSALEEIIEDIPSLSDPSGFQLIARRRDSLSAETSTNGDNVALNSTNKGELYVKHIDSIDVNVVSGGTTGTEYTEGDVEPSIMGNAIMMEVAGNTLQPVQGTVADGLLVNLGSNNDVVGSATNLDIRDLTSVDVVTVTGGAGQTADVKITLDSEAIVLGAGTANIGDVDVLTLPSIPAGTNNIGDVDIASISAGTNYIGKTRLTDGTTDAEVVPLAGYNAQAVAIVDASGNQVTNFGGGTEYTEGDTDATITGSVVLMEVGGNVVQPIQGTVADGLLVNLGANNDIVGNVAHDSADSGNPIKIGYMAENVLPTAVSDGDRANGISDLFGRLLVSHIPHNAQIWKSHNSTSTQTGVAIWTPTGGKKVVITSIIVGTYGTTSARVILWLGASGDTTYTAGTDQLVLAASFAPDVATKPGLVHNPHVPIFASTADHVLKITTDAAISIDVTVYGYEI